MSTFMIILLFKYILKLNSAPFEWERKKQQQWIYDALNAETKVLYPLLSNYLKRRESMN